jgi:phage protein D
MSQGHTSKFETTVDGQPLPAHLEAAVLHLAVENSVKLPDCFSIAFRDPRRDVLDAAKLKIGSKVEIRAFSEAAPQGEKLFSGEVTALEADLDAEATTTVVRGLDMSHRLFRGRTTESYANVTYSDVATKVAKRAGLEPGTIDATKTVHDHVSQGNVSDWDFLNGLAREVGFHVGVIDGKFDFRKPKDSSGGPSEGTYTSQDPLQLVMGKDLLRFRAVVRSSEQVPEVQVRGWDMRQKKAVVGTAPAKTTSAVIGTTPTDLAGTFASKPYVGVEVPYDKQSEVDAAAAALAEDVASSFAELEGVARGNPKIRAGRALSLALVNSPFDGKYSVTSSRHTYEPETGYTVWFTVCGSQDRSTYGLVANGSGGGSTTGSAAPPIRGVATAIVTDVNDPLLLGRVKVMFPWLSETYVSDWARTVQLCAGNGRGGVMLPEVNDEVLVAFDQGDLRRPFVLGELHNGMDKPQLGDALVDPSTGAVRRRGFISKKGAGLVFLDDDAKEGVTLFTGDHQLRIALNKTGTTIKVDSNGKVEITAATEVTVKAGTVMTLEAGASMELKAPSISINGSGPVSVKGQPVRLN